MRNKILFCIMIFLVCAYELTGQEPEGPPLGGGGSEIDVPIAGGMLYFIISLIVGGIALFRKRKGAN